MGLAVLRLFYANRDLAELTLCHADLLSGEVERKDLVLAVHVPAIAERLDSFTRELRSRASSPVTIPGRSCGRCSLACTCPEWAGRPRAHPMAPDSSRTDYVGPLVRLTPTSIERWLTCPRAYRAAHLLDLPTGRGSAGSSEGIAVHARLAGLHGDGPCRPRRGATERGPDNDRMAGFLARHARRCPQSAISVGHELDLAQLHTWGEVPIMVTARIDAVWERNGILDCRDYKTGARRFERVGEDSAARLQAWLLAPLAATRGLRLRFSYEQLSEDVDEDPEPFEPEDEDIAEIRRWIGEVGADIAMSDFAGVSDAFVCPLPVPARLP
jgi:hypothetical protein